MAVGVHLPAGERRVAKRNAALCDLFDSGGEDFDLHHKYHHTILLGESLWRTPDPFTSSLHTTDPIFPLDCLSSCMDAVQVT